jgi:phosphotransferase system  glucose/maltose/N-acetylglucosamine-specific IIC component
MEIVGFWIAFAVIVGIAASRRGRSGLGWFLLALVISPVIAGLLVLVLPSKAVDPNAPSPETHVKCPDCRELVLKDAKVCKHCGCKLVPQA